MTFSIQVINIVINFIKILLLRLTTSIAKNHQVKYIQLQIILQIVESIYFNKIDKRLFKANVYKLDHNILLISLLGLIMAQKNGL